MKGVGAMIGAAATAAFAFGPASIQAQQPAGPAQYGYGPHMMDMMYWGGGWFGMTFGLLFMILGLAIAIALAFIIVRALFGPSGWSPPSRQAPPERTPLDILKERFARGEIDKEEFEDRRRTLGD